MLAEINIDNDSWKSFLKVNAQASIFHSVEWNHLLESTYHYHAKVVALMNANGEITAGTPFQETVRITGKKRWISLPYTDHCTPIAIDNDQKQIFTEKLVAFVRNNPSKNFEFRTNFYENPLISSRCEYVLHNMILSPDVERTFSKIHDMHKRNANFAIKRGVRVLISREERYLREFYRLHLITRRRKGVPVQPWLFFKNILSQIIQQDHGFIMMAFTESKCIAAAVFLYFNDTLTYKFGASDPNFLYLRPNNLLFQEAIKWGCENGYSNLDLGRTDLKNTGLREFKTRWGAQESDLYYSYSPSLPSSRPNWIMHSFSKTITHSPLWFCRLLGELSYRLTS